MTDDELDARLSAAGARWRERNGTAAAVDLGAVTSAADTSATEDDDTGSEPLPLIPDRQPKPRRSRRTRVLLAASAAVAAAVVASVLAVQLGGGSSGGNHVAAQGGTPLTGTDWQLTATSKAGAATGVNATLHVTGSGELSGNDGCNAFGGHVSISADQLTLGRVVHTMMGCLGANGAVGQAVDAVLSGGTVQYAINGDTLTITKNGTGTLTYTATHLRATPATTDPAALTGTAWRLDTVQLGDNVDQPYGTASSAPPGAQIQFTQTELTGNDGCNAFSGKVELGAGTINVPSDLATTLKQCATSTSDWMLVLKGATRWEISGDQLTITDAHNGKLVFTKVPDISSASSTPATDSHALIGTSWTLISITHGDGGTSAGVPPSTAVTLFVDSSALRVSDCDAAPAKVHASSIDFTGPWADNLMGGCGHLDVAESHFVYGQLLTGTVSWSIRGGVLTITKDGVGSLALKPATASK